VKPRIKKSTLLEAKWACVGNDKFERLIVAYGQTIEAAYANWVFRKYLHEIMRGQA
jgi:hypothetical protein